MACIWRVIPSSVSGAALEFRLDTDGLRAGTERRNRPASREELLDALRATLARTPQLNPVLPDLPFSGGLVGVGAYDLVRYFERLPNGPVHPDNPAGAGSRLSRRGIIAGFRSI